MKRIIIILRKYMFVLFLFVISNVNAQTLIKSSKQTLQINEDEKTVYQEGAIAIDSKAMTVHLSVIGEKAYFPIDVVEMSEGNLILSDDDSNYYIIYKEGSNLIMYGDYSIPSKPLTIGFKIDKIFSPDDLEELITFAKLFN